MPEVDPSQETPKRRAQLPQDDIQVTVRWARTFWERARGLIGQPAPREGECFGLRRCRQVHTWGMGYPIDVVHVDEEGVVIIVQTLAPWRLGKFQRHSAAVLEFAAGQAAHCGIVVGARLSLREQA